MPTHKEESGLNGLVVYSAIISFLIVFLFGLYFGSWTVVGFDKSELKKMVEPEVLEISLKKKPFEE